MSNGYNRRRWQLPQNRKEIIKLNDDGLHYHQTSTTQDPMYPELDDRMYLLQRHYQENSSIEEISEEIDCSYDSVRQALHRWSIPVNAEDIKHPMLQNRSWVYERYVMRQMSTPEIAEKISASKGAVAAALERHDIETRSYKQAGDVKHDSDISNAWLQGCVCICCGADTDNDFYDPYRDTTEYVCRRCLNRHTNLEVEVV